MGLNETMREAGFESFTDIEGVMRWRFPKSITQESMGDWLAKLTDGFHRRPGGTLALSPFGVAELRQWRKEFGFDPTTMWDRERIAEIGARFRELTAPPGGEG